MDLENTEMVTLSPEQKELGFDFKQAKNGRYALLINYFTPTGEGGTEIQIEFNSEKGWGPNPNSSISFVKSVIFQTCFH
jgi:hypothetical protein